MDFEEIISLYEKKVYNIAYSILKNEQDAYDTSQEIFIKIYNNLNRFNYDSALSTWIHRIAVNTSIDEYRKKKRLRTNEFETIEDHIKDNSLTPEEVIIQEEDVKDIRESISLLKEEFKVIIILRDIQGLSYDEISKILKCSIGTVKSRLSRARKSLKNILEERMEQKN